MRIAVINGPNLNLLGLREPEIYGCRTYNELVRFIEAEAERLGLEVTVLQSNSEGALVDAVQAAWGTADGILINPAAYTHTSIALLDALKAVGLPAVEVHLSDPDSREPFRRVSYIRPACMATVQGQGFRGYARGLELLAERIRNNQAQGDLT